MRRVERLIMQIRYDRHSDWHTNCSTNGQRSVASRAILDRDPGMLTLAFDLPKKCVRSLRIVKQVLALVNRQGEGGSQFRARGPGAGL